MRVLKQSKASSIIAGDQRGPQSNSPGCHYACVARMQPAFGLTLKAGLDRKIFAYDYHARLASVITSQKIGLCNLDSRHPYDTLWMS